MDHPGEGELTTWKDFSRQLEGKGNNCLMPNDDFIRIVMGMGLLCYFFFYFSLVMMGMIMTEIEDNSGGIFRENFIARKA